MYIYIDRERDIASITVACVASDTGVALFPRCIPYSLQGVTFFTM